MAGIGWCMARAETMPGPQDPGFCGSHAHWRQVRGTPSSGGLGQFYHCLMLLTGPRNDCSSLRRQSVLC